MALTEREMTIVEYMAGLVGTSLDRIDASAKEMIKYNTGILTVLTGLATFFKIGSVFLVAPVVLIAIGLLEFIIAVQPVQMTFVVGDVNSSVDTYEKAVDQKSKNMKYGYGFTYLGFVSFILVLVVSV